MEYETKNNSRLLINPQKQFVFSPPFSCFPFFPLSSHIFVPLLHDVREARSIHFPFSSLILVLSLRSDCPSFSSSSSPVVSLLLQRRIFYLTVNLSTFQNIGKSLYHPQPMKYITQPIKQSISPT